MSQQQPFKSYKKGAKTKKIVLWCVIGLAFIIVLFNMVVVVDAGKTGIVITGGAVSETTFASGFHIKAPFIQSIVQVDNRTQKYDVKSATGASKDLQTVTTEIVVNYRVLNNTSANIYKNVGNSYETVIVAPAVPECLKAVTAQFTAEELITQRETVSAKIKDTLDGKMKPYGIVIESVNVQNFAFSDQFMQAVEAKQTAQQQALKAQQDLARIKIEAEQKVTQAKAEADSIKLIQDTLNTSPNYIEYLKWQKWNGQLPSVLSGNGSGLMVDIGNVTSPSPSPTK